MILISAGHTKDKPGACNDNVCEYDFTPLWRDRIVDILSLRHDVKAVPDGPLSKKVDFINQQKNVYLALEVHFNANIPNAKGSETLYYPGSEKGEEIASRIQDNYMRRDILQPNRGVKEGYYYKNGQKADTPLYFLRKVKAPAVIVEPEFMSQEQSIRDNYYMGCDAIAQAINEYCSAYNLTL